MRVYALNGTKTDACRGFAVARSDLLGERDDRTPFGRFVGQRGQIRDAGGILRIDASRR